MDGGDSKIGVGDVREGVKKNIRPPFPVWSEGETLQSNGRKKKILTQGGLRFKPPFRVTLFGTLLNSQHLLHLVKIDPRYS